MSRLSTNILSFCHILGHSAVFDFLILRSMGIPWFPRLLNVESKASQNTNTKMDLTLELLEGHELYSHLSWSDDKMLP
jgi:hypothetical protein